MNVLILGATGMLGHKLCQQFKAQFDVWATVRSEPSPPLLAVLGLPPSRVLSGIDVFAPDSLEKAFEQAQPDVVINGIGIIKQSREALDPYVSISVNALFPHQLAKLCSRSKARLIHISTDCVFSGRKGFYKEGDYADAEDLYGRTKYLGELGHPGSVTLRTSIIGPEIATSFGLLGWFLTQRGKTVKGYKKAVFSGFTTLELSRIIQQVIQNHPALSGLYQVSAEPIDKYSLLSLFRDILHVPVEITAEEETRIDRSLDSTAFKTLTGYQPPAWNEMIQSMADDMARLKQTEVRV